MKATKSKPKNSSQFAVQIDRYFAEQYIEQGAERGAEQASHAADDHHREQLAGKEIG